MRHAGGVAGGVGRSSISISYITMDNVTIGERDLLGVKKFSIFQVGR
jgi:hypothetical protein